MGFVHKCDRFGGLNVVEDNHGPVYGFRISHRTAPAVICIVVNNVSAGSDAGQAETGRGAHVDVGVIAFFLIAVFDRVSDAG